MAVIGFDIQRLTVNESAGAAVVTVRLLDGELSYEIEVTLRTQDKSAQGVSLMLIKKKISTVA